MSEVIALALSGSNPTGDAPFSCCLRVGSNLSTACSPTGERGDLALLASRLLAEHGLSPADIGELRVDLGPGSYTGLRVAITFVRFLQHFGDVPVLACDTLAMMASDGPTDRRLRPVLDARRGRFHCGALLQQSGVLHHVEPLRAALLSELLASAQPDDTFVVAPNLGDEPLAMLRAAGAIRTVTAMTAEQLFSPRLALAPCTTAELEPRYLMGSYAE